MQQLFEQLETERDEGQAARMAAYMQNRFAFLGIPKPRLNALMAPLLKASRKLPLDWAFVRLCWDKPYREAQYVGLAYLKTHAAQLTPDDLPQLEYLVTHRAWWDTVDTLDAMVGRIMTLAPALKPEILAWARSDDLWKRRAAIDCQQKLKERTDATLLGEILCSNLGSDEPFINKAIGWSLRDYARTDSEWVRAFVEAHRAQMDQTSLREAQMHLNER